MEAAFFVTSNAFLNQSFLKVYVYIEIIIIVEKRYIYYALEIFTKNLTSEKSKTFEEKIHNVYCTIFSSLDHNYDVSHQNQNSIHMSQSLLDRAVIAVLDLQ